MSRGGARPGAGRPKGKPLLIKKDFALELLGKLKYEEEWESLFQPRTVLDSDGNEVQVDADPKIKLEALKYLTDRAFGKAPQAVLIGGEGEKPLEIKFLGAPPAWAPQAQEMVSKIAIPIATAKAIQDEEEHV